MLNRQGPGKIGWTDWTWNPISGCLHGCPYCYMLRMEKRFPGIMQPKYRPEYLKDLQSKRLTPGDKIFVGSSGDTWGEWVKDMHITEVLFEAAIRPYLTFQFLTKKPSRYKEFHLENLDNCWFGTSVDGTYKTIFNLQELAASLPETAKKFVSFEPLIESPTISSDFYDLNWIIIGADSTRGAKKPPKAWADFLIREARDKNIPVWVKDNYGYPEVIKEFPII